MNYGLMRRIIGFTYTLIILLFIGLGFCYSNETNSYYRENASRFDDYWTVDGKLITFPYSNHEEFTMTNTLPKVYGDQILVLRCYYEHFTVSVDGKEILEDRPNKLFGRETNVGKKEIWVPLSEDYSGATISIRIKMQKALYGSELTEGFITTRSGYGIMQLKSNALSAIIFIIFTVTGVFEVIVAAFFILKRAHLIRKLSFEALFYAGWFSIVSAQWIINETRIPFILFGFMTGFSILTIISFLLMPLLFYSLSRTIYLRTNPIDNAIDIFMIVVILLSCLGAIYGYIQWGWLVYIAHALDVIALVMVSYYSFASVKKEQKLNARTGIALANGLFILIASYALFKYIVNINSSYTFFIIIDLMVYIMVQVGLVYRRIGLNVKEEKEFMQAKIYAFTDELTKLGNRRHFYTMIDDYEQNKLPHNLTYIAIDVNKLKFVNDNIGHDAGDELLIGTSQCIKEAFSSSPTTTISRMGGDEFAILIIAGKSEVETRIRNMKVMLSKWKGKYIDGITVAVGSAAVWENPDCSINDLSKIADKRMYEDKASFYKEIGEDRRTNHST